MKKRRKRTSRNSGKRPRKLRSGNYIATISEERTGPWGLETTWTITRRGVEVGKLFQGGGGYGERPTASLSQLVWSGDTPEGASSPKSPYYGMLFDIGPHDTREQTLAEFARRADRLIAWRAAQPHDPERDAFYVFPRKRTSRNGRKTSRRRRLS